MLKGNVYDRNELLRALSLALDLAENQPVEHAARTAYVSLRIAQVLHLPEEEVENIYIAAFLHDIRNVSSGESIRQLGVIFEKDEKLNHTEVGNRLMALMPFSPKAAEFVQWHHASWAHGINGSNGSAGTAVKEPDPCPIHHAPLGAKIIQLADQLDMRYDQRRPYFEQRSEHWDWVKKNRYNCSPDLVDAFLDVSSTEKFWLDFTSSGLEWILNEIQPNLSAAITEQEVEQIANVFAAIIDSKSSYTYHHSRGVAELMERLAPFFLDSPEEIFQLRIAALLHDLGKLAVPAEVLDKPGKLDPVEFEKIKAHPYYTKFILGRVKGFEVIKEWAGNHHESVDGSGYPERKTDLSIPERLMAVADVYQALTEERPYRQPMSSRQAIEVMKDMVRQKKLCVAGVAMLQEVI